MATGSNPTKAGTNDASSKGAAKAAQNDALQASEKRLVGMEAPVEVDLREPWLALFLAWLLPGAGHFYQKRYAKGALFAVCILGTWIFGMILGGGHVVYASHSKQDRRLHYYAQVLVGAPSLPALVQRWRVNQDQEPFFGGLMAPPKPWPKEVEMYQRRRQPIPAEEDELSTWNLKYHTLFELGTLYTVVAGLLNVLAMYDAFAGPAFAVKEEESSDKPPPVDAADGKKKKA